jgi:hypothetical protein
MFCRTEVRLLISSFPWSLNNRSCCSIQFVHRSSTWFNHRSDLPSFEPPKRPCCCGNQCSGRSLHTQVCVWSAEADLPFSSFTCRRNDLQSAPVSNPQSRDTAEAVSSAGATEVTPVDQVSVLSPAPLDSPRCQVLLSALLQKSSHLQGFAPPTSPYHCRVVANSPSGLSFHGLCSPPRSTFTPLSSRLRECPSVLSLRRTRSVLLPSKLGFRSAFEHPSVGSAVVRSRKRVRQLPPESVRCAWSQGEPC